MGKIDNENIEQKAQDLLDKYNITSVPVFVESIATNEGFNLYQAKFPDENISGYIDLSDKEIVINSSDPANRQTFTIAHELGHHILHTELLIENPDLGIFYRNWINNYNQEEKEANAFAAALLMPKKQMSEALKKYKDAPDYLLAKYFGVSLDAFRYRVVNLKLR